jgi:2-oxoglutarate ferredoxin oxidoreductase subunit alpha
MQNDDITIRIGGEAGMGMEASGAGFARALMRGGLHVFGLPDFHSRIRGGHNFFTLRARREPLHAIADPVHILLALDMETVRRHGRDVVPGGAIVHDDREALPEDLKRDDVLTITVPLTRLAREIGGMELMRNNLALGIAAGLLEFDSLAVESVIRDNFAGKGERAITGNIEVFRAGLAIAAERRGAFLFRLSALPDAPPRILVNGTQAFAMGALAGGCRFVTGYPMTPGSAVLTWFVQHGPKHGAIVKHVEDEIAAINMAIGAAIMGARAMVPTSGGGYSLMVEATGSAGISETPIVIYNAQRPGPATGLPTRTAQADLLFMLHASQDEFPRMVLAPGTPEEAFRLGWLAFNVAERYQTPVMVLSDQFLADALVSRDPGALVFEAVAIDRGALLADADLDRLEEPYRRYRISENGVSPRALPGHRNAVWVTESNEHDESCHIEEAAPNRFDQQEKRMRKATAMARETPPPTWYGPETAETTLVTWGSTYGPAREAVDRLNARQAGTAGPPGAANLLHFSGLDPFPPEAEAELRKARRRIAVEGNHTGQLESLIRARTGIAMDGHVRRFDGRPFRPEFVIAGLEKTRA